MSVLGPAMSAGHEVLRVLMVEDSDDDVEMLLQEIRRGGYAVEHRRVESPEEFGAALDRGPWDLILLDWALPGFGALAALRLLRDREDDRPVLVVSGTVSEQQLVTAMKAGAHDCILKDNPVRLVPAIKREMAEAGVRRQRREAERALRESEKRLRFVVTHTRDVHYRLRFSDMKYDYMSPAIEKVTGYSPDEINELGFKNLVIAVRSPGEGDVDTDEMMARRMTDDAWEFWADYQIRTRSGESRWLADHSFPWRDEDHLLLGTVGILVDVTERRRAEEEVQLLQKLIVAVSEASDLEEALGAVLRRICEATGWLLGQAWMPRTDGRLTCHPAWYSAAAGLEDFRLLSERTVVAPGEGLPGRAWSLGRPVWVQDVTVDTTFLRLDGALRAGLRSGVAVPVLARDEGIAVLEFFVRETRGEDERFMRLVSAAATQVGAVIRRKQAEDALRRSEEHFRSLFENALDIISVLSEDGTQLYFSPSVTRVLGFDPQELTGRNIFEFVHAEDTGRVKESFEELVRLPGTMAYAEARFRHKDGSWRILEAIGKSRIDEAGRLMVVVNSRDITERRGLEARLVQAEKMEAIGRLAGGVAHDFNNIMTAILGYAELMLRKLTADDPSRRNLREIQRAAERAAALTQQLLAFGRKQLLQPRVLDLREVVSHAEELLRRLIGEDVELVTRYHEPLGRVRADPVQIDQVVMNLAINARDAMPRGGRLTIELVDVDLDEGHVAKHLGAPGPYVVLSVTDTGIGMDRETQTHIFEPFFTTKETGKGTGLGLSTVYGIVKQSGGYISVYSEPGRGTTFSVYLPRVAGSLEAAAPPAAPVTEPPGGNETLLMVEDDEAVRGPLREILELYGYRVIEARDGHEAIELSEASVEPIHVLLTDLVMPRMTGPELASRVRMRRPDIKTVFMSGYADGLEGRGIPPGAPFLQKPFTAEALALKLRDVLDGGSAST